MECVTEGFVLDLIRITDTGTLVSRLKSGYGFALLSTKLREELWKSPRFAKFTVQHAYFVEPSVESAIIDAAMNRRGLYNNHRFAILYSSHSLRSFGVNR